MAVRVWGPNGAVVVVVVAAAAAAGEVSVAAVDVLVDTHSYL